MWLASDGWISDNAVVESEASTIQKKIDHNQLDQNKHKQSTDGMSSDEDVKMESVETGISQASHIS